MRSQTGQWASLLLGVLLAMSLALPAAAAEPVELQLNGETLVCGQIQIVDRRAFLPLEELCQVLGADWEGGLVLTRGERRIDLSGGEPAPLLEGDVTWLPVRAAAEGLGYAVGWDRAVRTVILVDLDRAVESTLADGAHQRLAELEARAAQPVRGETSLRITAPVSLGQEMTSAVGEALLPSGDSPLKTLLSALPLTDAGASYQTVCQVLAGLADSSFDGGTARVESDSGRESLALELTVKTGTDGAVEYALSLNTGTALERYADAGHLAAGTERVESVLCLTGEEGSRTVTLPGRAEARLEWRGA